MIGTHEPVHQGGMGMNHILVVNQVVQRCFHRRPQLVGGDNGLCQLCLHLLLPGYRIRAVCFHLNLPQFLPGQAYKAIFINSCQRDPAGFDPDMFMVFK